MPPRKPKERKNRAKRSRKTTGHTWRVAFATSHRVICVYRSLSLSLSLTTSLKRSLKVRPHGGLRARCDPRARLRANSAEPPPSNFTAPPLAPQPERGPRARMRLGNSLVMRPGGCSPSSAWRLELTDTPFVGIVADMVGINHPQGNLVLAVYQQPGGGGLLGGRPALPSKYSMLRVHRGSQT